MKSLGVPLLLFALPAMLEAFAPARHAQMLLVRDALADGEVWRLWTGHWVHFSPSHRLWNLAVLLGTGAWLERVRPGLLLRHTLFAAPFISLAILATEPGLQTYGGLSGLATSVVVLLGLQQLRTPGAARWLWAGLLALVAAKITTEAWFGGASLSRYETAGVRTAWSAHAAGAVAAAVHQGLSRLGGGGSTARK
ncbi:MAG: hypothetical protein QG602_922 [Verrucomicrobiota bacterium]|nr:hypothetical protein [Verrucomicrobiota bacterium]